VTIGKQKSFDYILGKTIFGPPSPSLWSPWTSWWICACSSI